MFNIVGVRANPRISLFGQIHFWRKSIERLSIHIVIKFEIFSLIANIFFFFIFHNLVCGTLLKLSMQNLVSTSYLALCDAANAAEPHISLYVFLSWFKTCFSYETHEKIFVSTLFCNWHWNCVKPTVLSWFKHNLPQQFITSYLQSFTCECSYLPRISHPCWVESWNNM